MNIKKVITIGVVFATASALALDAVEVIGVKARQRYPWNGLVDIDFTLDSNATEPYLMKVTAFDNVGKTNLTVRSVFTENVSVSNNPCTVSASASRIVWDASADLPNGFKCTNVLVTCEDMRNVKQDKLYCVIDISGGTNVTSYSVSYLDAVPAGGWSDEYKTKKIVLRRIDAGSFMMGSPDSEVGRLTNETYHKVTLSKAFYITIFEITESQYSLVSGGMTWTKKPQLVNYRAIRGDELTTYSAGHGTTKTNFCWPDSEEVSSSSFAGLLRAKTGITSFDLPTEAQWEYASKGDCITALNNGSSCTEKNVNIVGRNINNYTDTKGGASLTTTTYVGLYVPNALGLYDMLGNAAEWCRDAYQKDLGTADVCDPKGGPATIGQYDRYWIYRVIKGGGAVMGHSITWNGITYGSQYANGFLPYTACRSAARATTVTSITSSNEEIGRDSGSVICGFRVIFEVE